MDIGGWFKTHGSEGWLAACLPRPGLSSYQRDVLSGLGTRLKELGYTEESVRQWMGGWDLCTRRFEQVPSYMSEIRRADRLEGHLAAFGLMRQTLTLARATAIFGPCLPILHEQRMLAVEGDEVRPLADLYPCEGAYLFTDLMFSPYHRLPNHVYEIGGDSYCLARTVPRWPVKKALDVCTGSGVHAILAAGHGQQVTGVDINPRAVDFSRFNAIVNGVDSTCQFVRGSLFEPVEGQSFELITANTPFVPTPVEEQLEAFRWGGETGDDVNRALVHGLRRHLAPGGCLALFTNYAVKRGADRLDGLRKVLDWLGGSLSGWGLSLIHFGATPREIYIELQIFDWSEKNSDRYHRRFESWVQSYERQGIVAIGEGTFLVRRLPDDHPGYMERIDIKQPVLDQSQTIEDWQLALERYTHGGWQPAWDAPAEIHPRVTAVGPDLLGGPGWVRHGVGWIEDQQFEAVDLELVQDALRKTTVVESADRLGLSREAVRDRLRGLGKRLVLVS